MGRPSRSDLVLFVIAAALIVTGLLVLHGSPAVTRYYPLGTGRAKVVSQPTHAVDIIRTLMMIVGAAVALLALYRWGTAASGWLT